MKFEERVRELVEGMPDLEDVVRLNLVLGRFGDRRLQKGGFLLKRLVESGGRGVRVRRLGRDCAGEMRITRFLRNPSVSVGDCGDGGGAHEMCESRKV